jgi:hypothetical protein
MSQEIDKLQEILALAEGFPIEITIKIQSNPASLSEAAIVQLCEAIEAELAQD